MTVKKTRRTCSYNVFYDNNVVNLDIVYFPSPEQALEIQMPVSRIRFKDFDTRNLNSLLYKQFIEDNPNHSMVVQNKQFYQDWYALPQEDRREIINDITQKLIEP